MEKIRFVENLSMKNYEQFVEMFLRNEKRNGG